MIYPHKYKKEINEYVAYDSFFEDLDNSYIHEIAKIHNIDPKEICIDLYGVKNNFEKRYW